MKRLTLFPAAIISAVFLFDAQQAAAAVPGVDGRGLAAHTACPTVLEVPAIYHFDKIVFQIAGQIAAAAVADQPALDLLPRLTPLDIKVLDQPKRVADLKAKVLSFLGAALTTENRQAISINQVTYATAVCTPQGW